MSVATLTSKGQLTLPIDIRRALHAESGERFDCSIDECTGNIVLRPMTKTIDEVFGLMHAYAKASPVSVEGMRHAVAARMKEKRHAGD